MSNIIQGVKVNGVVYKYDYESLENLPDPELPTCDSNDEGKVLAVNDSGVPQWSTFPSGLPSSTASDSGKALVVNSTGNPAWRTLPSELPSSSASDARKALVVNSTGDPVWSGIDRCLPTYGSVAEGESKALMVVNDSGGLEWRTILPASGSEDEGKVLVVNHAGEPEWGDLSGVPDNRGSSLERSK